VGVLTSVQLAASSTAVPEIEPIRAVLRTHRPEDCRLAHALDVFVGGFAFDDVGATPLLDGVANIAIGIEAPFEHGRV
jgi:hypothetical protein